MSNFTTADMSKILVAGTLDELNPTLELAAQLSAIHIIDHTGDELDIGTPDSSADEISNRLAVMRSCMGSLECTPDEELIPKEKMQESLKSSLSGKVESATGDIIRLEEIKTNLDNLNAEIDTLQKLIPLGIEIELMSGYESIDAFVGVVANLDATTAELKAASADTIIFSNCFYR